MPQSIKGRHNTNRRMATCFTHSAWWKRERFVKGRGRGHRQVLRGMRDILGKKGRGFGSCKSKSRYPSTRQGS